MIDTVSVVLGMLTGIGSWLILSFLDVSGWVTACKIFAQWGFPIVIGISTIPMVNTVLNIINRKKK